MPTVYSKAHVVVHPSIADTFGLVIGEALACGTPVITTPIPEHTSLDLPLFFAYTVEEFSERVKRIYQSWRKDKASYETLTSHCRKEVLKYDVKQIFPKLEKLLIKVSKEKEEKP
jgi:glycosyltransferase involved in cell wall biosynthesis